ncbi:hypothetical protein J8TS2_42010 [Lederbergia ruris]|uniref:Ycf15 n=1 Tax=Lederbergia ruris TaxID=217495 RepID=A0ABQ4KRB4_9BACI|nr:hypothetical protein J8TS2_42010 [Lederbergia ruris]
MGDSLYIAKRYLHKPTRGDEDGIHEKESRRSLPSIDLNNTYYIFSLRQNMKFLNYSQQRYRLELLG